MGLSAPFGIIRCKNAPEDQASKLVGSILLLETVICFEQAEYLQDQKGRREEDSDRSIEIILRVA